MQSNTERRPEHQNRAADSRWAMDREIHSSYGAPTPDCAALSLTVQLFTLIHRMEQLRAYAALTRDSELVAMLEQIEQAVSHAHERARWVAGKLSTDTGACMPTSPQSAMGRSESPEHLTTLLEASNQTMKREAARKGKGT